MLLLAASLVPQLASATVDTAWVRRYDGPGHGDDWATALAVDSAGNVYVAGVSAADTGSVNLDFVTLKYRPNGDTAWVRRRDFGGNDAPTGLVVDAGGNVYVTGEGNGQLATIAYDSTGRVRWNKLYGNQAYAGGAGMDGQGNVLICGSVLRASRDCVTAKYLPNGDTAWVRYHNWRGDSDAGDVLALSPQDEVCVVGYCADTAPGGNMLIVKYGPTGDQLWSTIYDGPQHGSDWPSDVAVDREGNVIVTGVSDSGYGTELDYMTIKLSPTGETLWTRRYNGTGNGRDVANGVATDTPGNVYVTGYARFAGVDDDLLTIKYAPNGSIAWLARYDGPSHSGDGAYDIAVDRSGLVYVTGNSYTPQTRADCVTICYDTAGDTVWVRRYNSPANWAEYTTELALGHDGTVCVAGLGYNATNTSDILTIKYADSSGGVADSGARDSAELTFVAEPSPFRARTALRCPVAASSASALVLDAAGRQVRVLHCAAGGNSVAWDGKDDGGRPAPAGVYVVAVYAGRALVRTKVLKLE